jgi:glycine cleavage system H protein
MPITGKVLEMNKDIDSAPESVNNDAYGKGWMIKASIDNEAELADLLSADAYKALIGA